MGRVKLEHVTKRYEDVTAVDDMNLDIKDGEFVCFVGPSGCGKSTTLETIAGLTKPTEGTISIGDREVTRLPPKDRGIAMVFQNIALFPHMDVHDNISFGLRLRDFDQAEIDERVADAADILQIGELVDRMPDELSGGQRQRVAIGRAIVRDPDVFLMDEPLANLDAKLRVHMRTELQRLHKQLETTIIYVTHDQAEAMTMSDRIAILNKGKLQQIAPPLECYNRPANRFVAEFIGSPSMNIVEGELVREGLETPNFTVAFDPDRLPEVSIGDEVALGIRPEDVYLTGRTRDVSSATDSIDATTDVLEPMGDEIFIYLVLAGEADRTMQSGGSTPDQLLMSVSPDTEIEEDQDVDVVLDRAKVHLFETATGKALAHGIEDLVGEDGRQANAGVGTDSDR